jgi:integrase
VSVHKRGKSWIVRYRDGDRHAQKTFGLHRDAVDFDAEVRRRRRLGTLATLTPPSTTLNDYLAATWAPVHGVLLADRTRETYAQSYDRHIAPTLGRMPLHQIKPAVVARWQAVVLADGYEALRKARAVLSGILQTAVEGEVIGSNPVRLVRPPKRPLRPEVRPLAPAAVEALRAHLTHRDAMLVSLLAYAGLRPGEARTLLWGHVQERTLVIGASKTGRRRTVRLLDPLAQDLREWRLASGRPSDDRPVIPRPSDGGVMSARSFNVWRERVFAPALKAARLPHARPYDCRHSFASLLIHEGRSVIYVARQMGHSATETLGTYGHVIDELADQPNIAAEDAIRAARAGDVRTTFAS